MDACATLGTSCAKLGPCARAPASTTCPAIAGTDLVRRGGRVVECGGLENRCAGNRTEGSNPSLSATYLSISIHP